MLFFIIRTAIKVRRYLLYLAFILKLIKTLDEIKSHRFVKLITNG